MKTPFDRDFLPALDVLRPLARFLAGSREAGDELIQETALSALEARERYEDTGRMKQWLKVILYNHHFRELRRAGRFDQSIEIGEILETIIPHARPAGEFAAMLAEAKIALGLLKPQHAKIISLDVLGFSYDEIAIEESIVMGTVKSRLNRARTHMREMAA